jgi:hypothetical protein
MGHHLKAVAAMPRRNSGFGLPRLNRLLSASVLTITLIGCGSPTSRDILAYDACIARHPQEAALCEGPRQAYQLDKTALRATATATDPLADSP